MFSLSTINLDAPDPRALAAFYRHLLGWETVADEPEWVKLMPPDGRPPGMSFSLEPLFRRPTWPSQVDSQQMMIHLDIQVDDLTATGARALELGATLAEFQPQELVRVYFDPAGHPFCLWVAD
jgi:predicted enzyme related to lactoylglutathione lyase